MPPVNSTLPPQTAWSSGVLDRRRAGILLHPTSLPGSGPTGNLGPDSRRFVDFLHSSGVSVWQMLPLGPVHSGGSPYDSVSAHAGDARLISLEDLVERGWLDDANAPGDDPAALGYRAGKLRRAHELFMRKSQTGELEGFDAFVAVHRNWLDDYALYQSLKYAHGGTPWWTWPAPERDRDPAMLGHIRTSEEFRQQCFEQFVFFHQWSALKRYAHERDLLLFGDMPLFVAHDSADVWANRGSFLLDPQGRPEIIAGVPPDYFSLTGQRWGNPHYRWQQMQADGFRWWIQRVRAQLDLFDLIRVDHFRGFEACWAIPAEASTATDGQWVATPGDALFQTLQNAFPTLPLVAEDLGIITPAVHALRDRYGFPGMRVLQFAFGGNPDNPYLPHNHIANCVVYTGTHDNDTTLGWFNGLSDPEQRTVLNYLGADGSIPWPIIRAAFASVAQLAVVPMQDLLGMDSTYRMNTPGTTRGNWHFRFSWDQVPAELPARIRHLSWLYGRTR